MSVCRNCGADLAADGAESRVHLGGKRHVTTCARCGAVRGEMDVAGIALTTRIALREADRTAMAAVAGMRNHPEYVPDLHRLLGALGGLHTMLAQLTCSTGRSTRRRP